MSADRTSPASGLQRRCSLTRRFLSAFLDGEVSRERAGSIQRHLAACALCASHLEELINVAAVSHDLVGGGSPTRFVAQPDRFAGIVRRLADSRRFRLGRVLRTVLASRILRSLEFGSAHGLRGALLAEKRLLQQARLLARELAALNPTGERLALVRLERWLQSSSDEELRNSGWIQESPPPLPEASDPAGRTRVLRWARRALREFREVPQVPQSDPQFEEDDQGRPSPTACSD